MKKQNNKKQLNNKRILRAREDFFFFFFISTYFYIGAQPYFINWGYPLAMFLDKLLEDNRYKQSLLDLSRVLELSLKDAIRGPNVTAIERNLFCDPWMPGSLNSRLMNSRLLELLAFRISDFLDSQLLGFQLLELLTPLAPPKVSIRTLMDPCQ